MRLHLEFAIRWLFLFISQASLTTSDDMCSSTTCSSSSNGNSLNLLIKDIDIVPRNCSCQMTNDNATLSCSIYNACSPCVSLNINECGLVKPTYVKVVNFTIGPTCISTSVTSINCSLVGLLVPSEAYNSCQSSTKSLLLSSTKPVCYSTIKKGTNDLLITVQNITIDNDDDILERAFKEGNCAGKPAKPNKPTPSPSLTLPTSIYSSVATTEKVEYQSSFESTPKPETTGRPRTTPILVSGSMIMNLSTDPLQTPMMLNDSERDRHIGIGVGVGVGLGGGILLIIAIIIVILIFRRRRAESHKLRADNTTQPTAAAAAVAAASSESSYESYRVPVLAPYDNATNGVTASGYQTITYDNEPVGESNDGYTEIKEPEEASNHNGYADCRIGRNEVYSMYHEMGQDHDNISETPSLNIENETTVIDNDLYGK